MLEELESPKAIEAKLNINEATVVISNGVDKEKERGKPTGLVLAGVSASWLPDPIVDTLRNISFTAQPGEFVGVAGLVGAGKVNSTSLTFLLFQSNSYFPLRHAARCRIPN